MSAFITGSRAYGEPKPGSDIDLAILISSEQETLLFSMLEPIERQAESNTGGGSYRFGRLNLLCFQDELTFAAWKAGTEELINQRPVSRELAVEVIERHKREAKEVKQ